MADLTLRVALGFGARVLLPSLTITSYEPALSTFTFLSTSVCALAFSRVRPSLRHWYVSAFELEATTLKVTLDPSFALAEEGPAINCGPESVLTSVLAVRTTNTGYWEVFISWLIIPGKFLGGPAEGEIVWFIPVSKRSADEVPPARVVEDQYAVGGGSARSVMAVPDAIAAALIVNDVPEFTAVMVGAVVAM